MCGTDGETYKNDCELRKNACEKKLPLQVAYKGDCGKLKLYIYFKQDIYKQTIIIYLNCK